MGPLGIQKHFEAIKMFASRPSFVHVSLLGKFQLNYDVSWNMTIIPDNSHRGFPTALLFILINLKLACSGVLGMLYLRVVKRWELHLEQMAGGDCHAMLFCLTWEERVNQWLPPCSSCGVLCYWFHTVLRCWEVHTAVEKVHTTENWFF